jgi:tripartite-type tricarboxylate transporter receptor subunit TctC
MFAKLNRSQGGNFKLVRFCSSESRAMHQVRLIVRKVFSPAVFLVTLITLVNSSVHAQTYPSRPVRIIVPTVAGGALDTTARLLASKMSEIWKKTVYVENRSGANFAVAMDAVIKSDADGHTLLLTGSSGVTISPHVFSNMRFDPFREFKSIMTVCTNAFVLLVKNDIPASSPTDLVKYLQANPGKLSHASSSPTTMLASELFKMAANVDYINVYFRGAAQSILALQSGTTELSFVDIGTATPALDSKSIRAVAITSPERHRPNPEIPTFVEAGFSVSMLSSTVLMVSSSTPREIVTAIYDTMREALASPEVINGISALGSVVDGTPLEESDKALRDESDKWGKLIKERNIRLNP